MALHLHHHRKPVAPQPDASTRERLVHHLHECAAERGMGRTGEAHARLTVALAADPELTTEARRHLAAMDHGVLLRDVISRWHKATLEGCLPPAREGGT